VPAAEIEALVLVALRHHPQASGAEPQPTADSDRELIERHVERITLTRKHIKLQMRTSSDAADAVTVPEDPGLNEPGPAPCRWLSRASSTSHLRGAGQVRESFCWYYSLPI
jgi:hypothetical protein